MKYYFDDISDQLADFFEIKNQKIIRALVVFYIYFYVGIILVYFFENYLPIVSSYSNFIRYDYFNFFERIFDFLERTFPFDFNDSIFLGIFFIIVGFLFGVGYFCALVAGIFYFFPLLLPKYIIKIIRWIFYDNYEYEKILPRKKAPGILTSYFEQVIYEHTLYNPSLNIKLFKEELSKWNHYEKARFNKALIMTEIGIDVEAFSQVHLEYKEDLKYFFLTWIQSTNEKKLDFNSEAFKSAIFPSFNTWENCQFQNFGIICSKINPGMVEKIYDSEGNVFIKDIKDKINNSLLKLLSDKKTFHLKNKSEMGEIIELWHIWRTELIEKQTPLAQIKEKSNV